MYNRSKTTLERSDTRSPNGYRLEAGGIYQELQSVSWQIESVKLYLSKNTNGHALSSNIDEIWTYLQEVRAWTLLFGGYTRVNPKLLSIEKY